MASLSAGSASPDSLSLGHFEEHKLLFCFFIFLKIFSFLIYFLSHASFLSLYGSFRHLHHYRVPSPIPPAEALLANPLLLSCCYVCECVCMYAFLSVSVLCASMCVCICMYLCVWACVCVCVRCFT